MKSAKQVVDLMLESKLVRALCENTADAEAFAQQTGMTFNPASQSSGAKIDANTPEKFKQYFAQIPRTWEFTDRRPKSETAGMTFYVDVGTPLAEIQRRYQQKAADWIESFKPKAKADPAFGIQKDNPVDAVAQQKKLRSEWE